EDTSTTTTPPVAGPSFSSYNDFLNNKVGEDQHMMAVDSREEDHQVIMMEKFQTNEDNFRTKSIIIETEENSEVMIECGGVKINNK
ncbi:19120_t:CDS:1, partial [Racocetra fulgida]